MAIKITKIRVILMLSGVALAAWIFFHPRRQVEPEELTPPLQSWVAQSPFGNKFEAKLRRAKLRSKITYEGDSMVVMLHQSADVPAAGVTRKTTHHYLEGNSAAVQEENTRLSVGPIMLLQHYRNPLPIVGDLLPFSFWHTRRLRDLVVQQNTGFPSLPDGRFAASYFLDELFSDGTTSRSASESMQCAVTGSAPAAQFLASLRGDALLYRCIIKTAKEAKTAGEGKNAKIETYVENVVQENVYFPALAWSYSARSSLNNNVNPGEMLTENTLLSVE